VLQPEVASTRRADRKAVAGLAVGTGKLAEVAQVIHFACRLDRRDAEAADAEATDVKRILHPAKGQDAVAPTPAANVGRLYLVHLDGRVRRLPLDRVRSERDALRASDERQHARTHE